MVEINIPKIVSNASNFTAKTVYPQITPKTIKKISPPIFKASCQQAIYLSLTELLQEIVTIGKEINEIPDDSLAGQDKFDLLYGDLELLLVQTYNEFQSKFDKSAIFKPKVDIEDLKKRVQSWSCEIKEVNA